MLHNNISTTSFSSISYASSQKKSSNTKTEKENICRNKNKRLPLIHTPRFKKVCRRKDLIKRKHKKSKRIKRRHNSSASSSSNWLRNKKKINNQEKEDQDVEILHNSMQKSIRCPLTRSIMIEPMKSTVCNHVFERHAIIKYMEQKIFECTICTLVNTDKSKLCTVCGGTLKRKLECPVFGCTKTVSPNCLVFDKKIVELVENEKKNKNKAKNEEYCVVLDDEMVILTKDYHQKCASNAKLNSDSDDVEILTSNMNKQKTYQRPSSTSKTIETMKIRKKSSKRPKFVKRPPPKYTYGQNKDSKYRKTVPKKLKRILKMRVLRNKSSD